jgi:hypothetical protein
VTDLKPTPTPGRPKWMFPLVTLGLFATLLLAVEYSFEWFNPIKFRRPLESVPENTWTHTIHRKSTRPGVPYELNPGARGSLRGADISINSLGARGPEVPREKQPGVLRIVSMGASVGFGWTVKDDESYPARLEAHLNERAAGTGTRYEVLNFGVGGYATRDEVAALEQIALPLDPDLVIIDYHPNGPEAEPIQPLHKVFREPAWWEHWNLLRGFAAARREWGVRSHGGHQYFWLHSDEGPHWPEFLKAYDKAKRLCDERGLKVVIAGFPSYGQRVEWDPYPFESLIAQVREAAESRGFLFVDMLPIYRNSGLKIPDIAVDDEHPGKVGLDLAGAELARAIWENHERLFGRGAPSK